MSNLLKYFVSAAALVAASASNAFAISHNIVLPPVVPAAGGLLGLAIVGVVGGVWLARRKR